MTIPFVDAAYSNAGTLLSAGASYMARLVANLISQGAVAVSSGDGTTFNASGWGGALNTTNAWVQIKLAGTPSRYLLVQKDSSGTTSYNWAILTSMTGFSGGTGAVAATAADQRFIWGAIGPGPATFFSTASPADYTMHTIILPGAAMGFAMVAISNGTGLPIAGLMIDPLRAGTYTALDTDPCAYLACGGTTATSFVQTYLRAVNTVNAFATAGVAASNGLRGLLNNATFQGLGAFGPTDGGGSNIWPGQLGPNPLSGKDPLMWCDYGRISTLTAPNGPKGSSSMVKLRLTARNTNDRFSLVTTGDHIVIGDLVLPWNGTATSGVTYGAEMLQPLGVTATYKMRGFYVAGGVFETWVASDPALPPPSGHTLANRTVVAIF